ncbi:MAG: Fe-S cluster assembly protein SufD [Alphaproteobacteria bacterium]|nr:Fe-S cluster assembly protein SufD [Alphaproteobacteria bacterium]
MTSAPSIVEQFTSARTGLPGAGRAWLDALRREALDRFAHNGFPTPKVEAWKFTDLHRIAGLGFDNMPAAIGRALTQADITPHRLSPDCRLAVFVNGMFRPDLSDLDRADGLRVRNFAAADDGDLHALATPPLAALEPRARSLADLNTAFMRDGAVIDIEGCAALAPVQLLFVASPQGDRPVFHVRNLIRLGAHASATVVETYIGHDASAYWTNSVTRVEIADGAVLRHCRLQAEGAKATHVAASSVRVARAATYHLFAAALGAELARNEVEVELVAPDATAELAGVTLARGHQHLDTTTRLNHAQPRGTSRQEFRNVVDDHAHAVFQGSVTVAPGAQKTDAQQQSRSLLLAASAMVDTKPELEILADDVKCSHGAAIGDLEAEQLFYLRARGIDEAEARALLIGAFIGHLIDGLGSEDVRPFVRRHLAAWLAERRT